MSGDDTSPSSGPQPPFLRIVTPDTTDEEIAALVAALAALRPAAPPPPKPRSEWASPHRTVRVRYSHGPGGWRSSGLPR